MNLEPIEDRRSMITKELYSSFLINILSRLLKKSITDIGKNDLFSTEVEILFEIKRFEGRGF